MSIIRFDDNDDADELFDFVTLMIVVEGCADDDIAEVRSQQHREMVVPQRQFGSKIGRQPRNIDCHRVIYSHLLYQDFWGHLPVYNPLYFKRFFKISIALFNLIVNDITAYDDYFRQKSDAMGHLGLSLLQKIASVVRHLISGVSTIEHDDKYRMGASMGLEAMKRFCLAVNELYLAHALRNPTATDIDRLLDESLKAGFPRGCLGSIDYMHWIWKNCPTAWERACQG